jgi:hypothetical protein
VLRLTSGGTEDTGVVEGERGPLYAGVVPGNGAPPAATDANVRVLLPPAGFDVPVAASFDGTFVAVRHFTGTTTDQPGSESIVIVTDAGDRIAVNGDGPLSIAGWMLPIPGRG